MHELENTCAIASSLFSQWYSSYVNYYSSKYTRTHTLHIQRPIEGFIVLKNSQSLCMHYIIQVVLPLQCDTFRNRYNPYPVLLCVRGHGKWHCVQYHPSIENVTWKTLFYPSKWSECTMDYFSCDSAQVSFHPSAEDCILCIYVESENMTVKKWKTLHQTAAKVTESNAFKRDFPNPTFYIYVYIYIYNIYVLYEAFLSKIKFSQLLLHFDWQTFNAGLFYEIVFIFFYAIFNLPENEKWRWRALEIGLIKSFNS